MPSGFQSFTPPDAKIVVGVHVHAQRERWGTWAAAEDRREREERERVGFHGWSGSGPSTASTSGSRPWQCNPTMPVFGFQIPNSKKIFRHLHGDLNLGEIKNAL